MLATHGLPQLPPITLNRTKFDNPEDAIKSYRVWFIANRERKTTLYDKILFQRTAAVGQFYMFWLIDGYLEDMDLLVQHKQPTLTIIPDTESGGEAVSLPHNYNNLDKGLDAYTVWFKSNVETITDPLKMVDFLMENANKSLDIYHLIIEEFNELRGKTPRASLLWTPERDLGQYTVQS